MLQMSDDLRNRAFSIAKFKNTRRKTINVERLAPSIVVATKRNKIAWSRRYDLGKFGGSLRRPEPRNLEIKLEKANLWISNWYESGPVVVRHRPFSDAQSKERVGRRNCCVVRIAFGGRYFNFNADCRREGPNTCSSVDNASFNGSEHITCPRQTSVWYWPDRAIDLPMLSCFSDCGGNELRKAKPCVPYFRIHFVARCISGRRDRLPRRRCLQDSFQRFRKRYILLQLQSELAPARAHNGDRLRILQDRGELCA